MAAPGLAASPRPVLPDLKPVALAPSATMRFVRESSGLVASRKLSGTYWTHGDSGTEPLLHAADALGRAIGAPVRVPGARNLDWEDIGADGEGNLWIGDIGNNFSVRTDLCVWVLPEPDPRTPGVLPPARRIPFRYPDQTVFPSPGREFDAEALFVHERRIYVLTKRHRDLSTVLYRLDTARRPVPAVLERLDSFEIGGLVTAADLDEGGTRLAVLTYTAVWLFEAPADGWLRGAVRWLPIRAGACEALAFSRDGTLLIGNEQGRLYRLSIEDLVPVRTQP